jgi:ABC-type transport system substrate-binding protein
MRRNCQGTIIVTLFKERLGRVHLSHEIHTSRAPAAICEVTPGGISRNLLINRDRPPFNDPEMRRAMALSIDRHAFIDIISEVQQLLA